MSTNKRMTHYPNGFKYGVSLRGQPIALTHAGNVWWVGSTNASDGSNNGKTPERPFATLDYAIGRCTANNGDIIFVSPNHTETVTAAGGITIDVAGVTIIGLGVGQDRPTITFTTDAGADIDMSAADCRISGMIFKCNIASQVAMITVSAVGCQIDNCEFSEGSATGLSFITTSGAANACDDLVIADNYMYAPTAGNYDYGIELEEVEDSVRIEGNTIIGDFDSACIHNPTGKVMTHLQIVNNICHNLQSGQHAIELVSACTGALVDNRLFSDAYATTLDPGSLKCTGNIAVTAIDAGGAVIPAAEDTTDNYIGTDDSNNAAATTNVAANEDGSILERLEQIQEAVNKGTGTAVASNKSVIDAIGFTGSAATGNQAGSLATAPGTELIIMKTGTSNLIPNNTQTVALTGASSGTLLLKEVTFNTDATGIAGPTNIELSTDNAKGVTGADGPIMVEVIGSFGANATVVATKDATSHTLPYYLETGKKIYIHGDDGVGTGAGTVDIVMIFERVSAGATIAAS